VLNAWFEVLNRDLVPVAIPFYRLEAFPRLHSLRVFLVIHAEVSHRKVNRGMR